MEKYTVFIPLIEYRKYDCQQLPIISKRDGCLDLSGIGFTPKGVIEYSNKTSIQQLYAFKSPAKKILCLSSADDWDTITFLIISSSGLIYFISVQFAQKPYGSPKIIADFRFKLPKPQIIKIGPREAAVFSGAEIDKVIFFDKSPNQFAEFKFANPIKARTVSRVGGKIIAIDLQNNMWQLFSNDFLVDYAKQKQQATMLKIGKMPTTIRTIKDQQPIYHYKFKKNIEVFFVIGVSSVVLFVQFYCDYAEDRCALNLPQNIRNGCLFFADERKKRKQSYRIICDSDTIMARKSNKTTFILKTSARNNGRINPDKFVRQHIAVDDQTGYRDLVTLSILE